METVRVRLVAADRADAALAALVESATGRAGAVFDRLCPACGSSAHGRPLVRGGGPPVSLARAAGLALVAVGQDRPIGIDLEPAGTATAAALEAAGIPCPDGADPTTLWVRAEAVGKARGTGLGPVVEPGDVVVVDLDAETGLVAAVAATGAVPIRVEVSR